MRALRRAACIAAASGLFLLVLSALIHAGVDPIYQEGLDRLQEDLQKQGFASEELAKIFSDSRFELYPRIVGRTGKGMNYLGRRFGLLTKRSIKRGRSMLETYGDSLRNAERSYGVEKEIIVAILRVETNFGSATGVYPVLNSLATMAIIDNRRSEWARKELSELLAICKEQNRDPFTIRGSWAGAFGISQFIPSSYVRFAVDGNSDGKVDLFTMSDAVASVANYLKSHGWEKGRPKENRQAVYAYNHCDSYVKAVFAYAKALSK
ncbi:MAG: lytic murein transglycosylase [Syntrophorhabdaceae bacterium]|nr:lytic murein transglycosylase [Syntrophorhabdaceae bacterium]